MANGEGIKVLAATDREHLYIGYNPNPGTKALTASIRNEDHITPDPVEAIKNSDGSVTMQFMLSNVAMAGTVDKRRKGAARYYLETVLPQLEENTVLDVYADTVLHEGAGFRGADRSLFVGQVVLEPVTFELVK